MRLVLVLACFVLSGSDFEWSCRQRLTDPRDDTGGIRIEIRLSSASGDLQHPLDASATVTNGRPTRVYHAAPCRGSGIGLRVLGPAGGPLHLTDPRVLPACPEACCVPLEAGEPLTDAVRFDGRLFGDDGRPYLAPGGDYVVEASFAATAGPEGGTIATVTRRARFRWTGP